MINGKQNRFNQLLNSIEEGNPKTLTIRLREMEKSGLIKRKVYYHGIPIKIEYYPTEKGLALQLVPTTSTTTTTTTPTRTAITTTTTETKRKAISSM
ncbi:MAG: winged helix-turn-helix transcriptional regulator [Nitrososphaeraceae archaeon]